MQYLKIKWAGKLEQEVGPLLLGEESVGRPINRPIKINSNFYKLRNVH